MWEFVQNVVEPNKVPALHRRLADMGFCWRAFQICSRCQPCPKLCQILFRFCGRWHVTLQVGFPWCTATTTNRCKCHRAQHRLFQSTWRHWCSGPLHVLIASSMYCFGQTLRIAQGKPLPRIYTHRHFTLFYNNDQIIEVVWSVDPLAEDLLLALLFISKIFRRGRHGTIQPMADLSWSSVEFLLHSPVVSYEQRVQGQVWLCSTNACLQETRNSCTLLVSPSDFEDRTNRYLDPKFFEHKAEDFALVQTCFVKVKASPGSLVFDRQLFYALPISLRRCCHHFDEDTQAPPSDVHSSFRVSTTLLST